MSSLRRVRLLLSPPLLGANRDQWLELSLRASRLFRPWILRENGCEKLFSMDACPFSRYAPTYAALSSFVLELSGFGT